MVRFLIVTLLWATSASSDTLFAAQTVRAHEIISPTDVVVSDRDISGMLQNAEDAIGLEARVTLYAGRPIRIDDVGPPAIIERNQIVNIVFRRGGLVIAAEARALGRASAGDRLRVMNLGSRTTVVGTVLSNGTIMVGGPDISRLN